MSSDDAKNETLKGLFPSSTEARGDESLDDAYSTVSSELTELRRQLFEERFCWIVFSLILLDVIFFDKISIWAIPVAIMVLELILLLVIASRLGITEIRVFFYRLIDGYAGKKSGSE